VALGDMLRLCELPCMHRRGADVSRLATLDDIVQRLHRFFDRSGRVPAVNLVQVNEVSAEPGKAGVDLVQDRLARQPAAVGPIAHPAVHLGGDDELIAPRKFAQCAAHNLFARAIGIDVGGVEKVDAEFDCLPDQRAAGSFVECPRVVAAIGYAISHATQADARNNKACRAQAGVFQRWLRVLICRAAYQWRLSAALGASRRDAGRTAPGPVRPRQPPATALARCHCRCPLQGNQLHPPTGSVGSEG
jgi:hypothetical protein